MRKRAVVAGATGLVGRAVTLELCAREDVTAVTLVRKGRGGAPPEAGRGLPQPPQKKSDALDARARQLVFDYEADADWASLGRDGFDFLFCTLGTTRRKAGSDEAFRRVDHDYPVRLIQLARELRLAGGDPVVGLVSSAGADAGRGLYLRTKLEVERALAESGVRHVIVRPSILDGEREESRPGERVGLALGSVLGALKGVSKTAQKWAPVRIEIVARALVRAVLDAPPEAGLVLEGGALLARGELRG